MLLSVVSSRSQLNWLINNVADQPKSFSANAVRYEFKVKLGGERCFKMFLNSIEVKNARLCMLIMCGMCKQFVEFIKESRCGHNTKIWAHSTVQCFL